MTVISQGEKRAVQELVGSHGKDKSFRTSWLLLNIVCPPRLI